MLLVRLGCSQSRQQEECNKGARQEASEVTKDINVLSSKHERQEKCETDENNDIALFLRVSTQISPVEYHEWQIGADESIDGSRASNTSHVAAADGKQNATETWKQV